MSSLLLWFPLSRTTLIPARGRIGYRAETAQLQSRDSGFGDDEPIAHTRLGLDRDGCTDLRCELRAQALHVHVDGAVAARHRIAPDAAVESLAAEGRSLYLDEGVEHVSLSPRERQPPAMPRRLAALGIDAQR